MFDLLFASIPVFIETLSYMWKGMLGVFIVIALIIVVVYVMLAVFKKTKKKN